MEKARLVFDEMSEPDLVSWNALIPGYYLQGFYDGDDTEELQEWDQQIFGLYQALNGVLDSMAKKCLPIPV
ncbi:hypothetical protein AgCh_034655 [Apium graveolens]